MNFAITHIEYETASKALPGSAEHASTHAHTHSIHISIFKCHLFHNTVGVGVQAPQIWIESIVNKSEWVVGESLCVLN